MLRQGTALVLTALLLFVAAATPATSSPAAREHGDTAQNTSSAASHLPVDLQMDRDVANVAKTSVSPVSIEVQSDRESADLAVAPLSAPAHRAKQHTPIIKQQHVFRI